MGWTSYYPTHFTKRGTIDRKAECDAYFMEGLNRGNFLVLKSAMKGSTYYAAVKSMVRYAGKDENGKFVRRQLEVDFVVNRPPYRVYIQSAFHMPTPEKEQQERRPLLSINDHFRKIVIVGDDIHRKEDELGVLTIGLLDFLTDKELLEQG